jgi:Spy/CpxP family protein refolding chaperone
MAIRTRLAAVAGAALVALAGVAMPHPAAAAVASIATPPMGLWDCGGQANQQWTRR